MMFWKRKLSETAKAVIWLWQNDAKNWVIGSHAVVHQKTGIAVWTANDDYVSLYCEIPDDDRANAHPCNGRQVRLEKRDRLAIYKAVVLGMGLEAEREIQRQIADWFADNIEHRVRGRATARIDR